MSQHLGCFGFATLQKNQEFRLVVFLNNSHLDTPPVFCILALRDDRVTPSKAISSEHVVVHHYITSRLSTADDADNEVQVIQFFIFGMTAIQNAFEKGTRPTA
jgi:hypothetical protein